MEIKETDKGVVFRIKAVPNARVNALAGEYNGMLKVKVAAVPEKGKANEELAEYLSGLLGISRSRVSVIKGEASREKTVLALGLNKKDILKIMEAKDGRTEKKSQGSSG